jgi:hypothetical protein
MKVIEALGKYEKIMMKVPMALYNELPKDSYKHVEWKSSGIENGFIEITGDVYSFADHKGYSGPYEIYRYVIKAIENDDFIVVECRQDDDKGE